MTDVKAGIKFPVEAGHIMMFARSIGDENPIYHDGDYAQKQEPEGIIAPPTFMQASAQFDPDYFLRPKAGEPWFGSGKNPTGRKPSKSSNGGGDGGGDGGNSGGGDGGNSGGGGGGGGLHAEQHFEYHRHPKAGDVLTLTNKPGKTWTKDSKRAGQLKFSESITEYRDQNGELVVTARMVGVTTERPVSSD